MLLQVRKAREYDHRIVSTAEHAGQGSLILGIVALALVFGIGLCSLVGMQ
jgi:hypothetical protein